MGYRRVDRCSVLPWRAIATKSRVSARPLTSLSSPFACRSFEPDALITTIGKFAQWAAEKQVEVGSLGLESVRALLNCTGRGSNDTASQV